MRRQMVTTMYNNYYYCRCCCCCRCWHLLLGLLVLRPSISSLLQSATSVITKCDSFFYYKVRWSVITKCDKCYYKVRQVLQSVTILLQSATVQTMHLEPQSLKSIIISQSQSLLVKNKSFGSRANRKQQHHRLLLLLYSTFSVRPEVPREFFLWWTETFSVCVPFLEGWSFAAH